MFSIIIDFSIKENKAQYTNNVYQKCLEKTPIENIYYLYTLEQPNNSLNLFHTENIKNVFEKITEMKATDIFIYIGGIIGHNIINTNDKECFEVYDEIVKLCDEIFGINLNIYDFLKAILPRECRIKMIIHTPYERLCPMLNNVYSSSMADEEWISLSDEPIYFSKIVAIFIDEQNDIYDEFINDKIIDVIDELIEYSDGKLPEKLSLMNYSSTIVRD